MTWLQTWSGRAIDFDDLLAGRKTEIRLVDIAKHLANLCRFTGAVHTFYSVAEHSLLVEDRVRESTAADRNLLRVSLMHDAAKAYLNDIAAPVKHLPHLAGYCELEHIVQRAVERHFGLRRTNAVDRIIRHANLEVMSMEARQSILPARDPKRRKSIEELPPPPPNTVIRFYQPGTAYSAFMTRATELGIREIG